MNQAAKSSLIPAELRTQPVAHDGGGINKDQNAPDNGTLIEQAETRTKEANLRTDQANTRTDEANTRTSLANTRTAEANTRTDEANTRTTEANTRTEQADLRTEKAETQTEALRTSELSYRRLFESARDGILVLNVDTGRTIDVNDFLVEMLGYSRDEIIGKTVGELSPLKDILFNQGVLKRLQKDGYIRYEDLPLETRDGRRIAVEFVSNLYQVGDIKVIQCNIRDITEHKRTEAAMFASEARYRRLFEAAKDGILILNAATGRIVDANPFLAELLGDARETFIGKHLWEMGFFKDIAANEANFKELQAKDYVRYDDLPLETSDGRRINVEFVSNAYNVDGHRVVQCNIRDITERKRAEVALQAAQLFLTEIVNALPVRVFWKDKNLVYLGCNTVFARDAGIAGPEDIIGKDDRQMVWREQAEAFRSDDREVIMSGQSKLLIEESKTTPEGKTITVLASKIPLCDAKGEIIGMIGTYMDITARKRVQESQTRLAMAVEQATESVVITDTGGTILYANPAFEKTSGYTRAEALGQNPRILKSGKQDDDFYVQMWESLRRGETWSGHFINRRKNGTLFEEDASISPVRDAADKVVNYVAVKRDVTHEVQLEAQIRQSQKNAEEVLRKVSRQAAGRKKTGILLELVVIFGLGTLIFAVLKYTNLLQTPFNNFVFNNRNDLDEVFGALAFMLLGFFVFYYRRWRNVKSQVGEQANIEVALRILHGELEKRVEQRTAELTKSNDALLTEIAGRKKMELERQKLEAQFRQSQKMEAIGQLAGGVAHDFNNILAVIQMQASLLKSADDLSAGQTELADGIGVAVQRAVGLTRQLLMFSRKGVLQSRDLDLNLSVAEMTKMLTRILGENIAVQLKLAAQAMFLHADAGMMDQVLLNLAVNARDAMPEGGQLVIETAGVEFDEFAATQTAQARPGSFVRLSVSDNGCGIPPENLAKIFEPFFTTKGVGKGTGLGLATVFGIAKQHQGWVNVYSEVGHGTTFKVYLPRLAESHDTTIIKKMPATAPTGHETILLVEDEPALRTTINLTLSRLGYRVLEAGTGVRALEVWKEHHGGIQLLLTDLMMPDGMTGKELGQRLFHQNPKLKVIYMSGYSADIVAKDFPLQEGVNFLIKPFQVQQLAQTIRQSLDQN
jgi:PAS domain S-box-containing protein